ncbi:MAG: dienelactone hydrolase family protein [Bacteroidetes bacterium]|nr:dienelactone hydrolase family protein [Bacteroidota bacterium]
MPQSHHITVSRTARYYTLGTLSHDTQEIWVVIHGWAQLAEAFISGFTALDDGTRYIVAPEALNRFYLRAGKPEVGATWMTREDREAEMRDYINYLDMLYDELKLSSYPAKIVVLGFSQGVATLSRWVYRNERRIDALIFYAGEIANELQNEESVAAFQQQEKYFICGTEDPFINELNLPKVTSLLKDFTVVMFEGGHEMKADTLVNI